MIRKNRYPARAMGIAAMGIAAIWAARPAVAADRGNPDAAPSVRNGAQAVSTADGQTPRGARSGVPIGQSAPAAGLRVRNPQAVSTGQVPSTGRRPAATTPTGTLPTGTLPTGTVPTARPRGNAPAATPTGTAPVTGRRGNPQPGNVPAGVQSFGRVTKHEAGKSLTIEIRRRRGALENMEYKLSETTRVEGAGDAKTLAADTMVTVYTDPADPKTAARVVVVPAAGARTRPGNPQPTNPQPATRRPNNGTPGTPPATPNPRRPAGMMSAVGSPGLPAQPPPPPRPAFAPREPVAGLAPREAARRIDDELERRLSAAGVAPAPLCDDADFLRRIYLDVIGTIPSADAAAAFLLDRDPDKRARLVDGLLADPRYGRHFADVWCGRILSKDVPVEKGAFLAWLADGFNAGRGWDELVTQLLTAEGPIQFAARGKRMASSDPAAFFVLVNTEGGNGMATKTKPEWLAAESARLFLGVQIQCAECHDHPFTPSWKQDDFWGLAAFYGGLRVDQPRQAVTSLGETPAPGGQAVSITIPTTALKNVGRVVPARLVGAPADYRPAESERLRTTLARWMTSSDNRLFAEAAANRAWAHFFGRGLVNPVDDLRPDNPATHPEILALLTDEFRRSQFDLRHLVRSICLSRAYQRTSARAGGKTDTDVESNPDNLYARMPLKVMSPGVFYDSLAEAAGVTDLRIGLPERKTILTTITDLSPRETFVDFFRAAVGEEPDPLEYAQGMPQKLKLLNSPQFNAVPPTAVRLAAAGTDRRRAIDELYLTAYARRPTPEETRLTLEFLDQRAEADPAAGYAAVLWVLLNSGEFVLNH